MRHLLDVFRRGFWENVRFALVEIREHKLRAGLTTLGIVLGVTTAHALHGRYDHENYTGVKSAAMYWHFLDVVWIIMYLSILFAG